MDDIKDSTLPVRCYSYIRFSSKEQRKGDSLRRQTAYAEEYAKEHGLLLDDSLKITDFGFSAFHGDHITKGALGVFLEQVKAGKIPKGSHLVIEALDRLTREELLGAVNLFTGILLEDIILCTAADNMVYRQNGFQIGELIISAVKLSQAHEESFKKQQRILKSWEGKRANSANKKLTAKAPAWLKLSKDKIKFHVILERAEVVKKIFQMRIDGCGTDRLTRTLNKSDCWKPKSLRSNLPAGWQRSYIDKILRSKSVIGEFQMHARIDGKRKPVGDPIPDYYPRIIEDDIFYAVQEQFVRNEGKGGKNGKLLNLFGTLAKCGYCGAPMQFINKGPLPKGGKYLVCDNARRAIGCTYHSVQYQPLENLVLKYCKGLDPTGILPDASKTRAEIIDLQNGLAAVRGKLTDTVRKIENLTEAITDSPSKRVRDKLQERLDELMLQSEQGKEEEQKILNQISRLNSDYSITQKQLENIKDLIEKLPTAPPEIRESLRSRLRSLIDKIVIYPVGNPLLTPEYIETYLAEYESMMPEVTEEEIQQYRFQLTSKIGDKKLATCNIYFRSGSIRNLNLFRNPEMPLELDKEGNRLIHRLINEAGVEDDIKYKG